MFIGVPKELKEFEGRVGLDPAGVAALVKNDILVFVENEAGKLSGFSDDDYLKAGAILCPQKKVWQLTDMIVKVKEPLPQEYEFFRKGLKIMTFFHFPANPELKKECERTGVVAIPYEYIQTPAGSNPILQAMSKVAGEVAADMAAQFLRSSCGGKGVLMSDAIVSIVGVLGNVGSIALSVLEHRAKKIFCLDNRIRRNESHHNCSFLISTPKTILESISQSDVVIGA